MQNWNIDHKTSFAGLQTQGSYSNEELSFKTNSTIVLYPKKKLALDSRIHTRLEYDNNGNLYSTLNIDRVNREDTLKNYSSDNLYSDKLKRATLISIT